MRQFAEHDAAAVHRGGTGRGGAYPAAALEQEPAQRLLGLEQHPADRRLTQVQATGCGAHGAGLGQRHQ